MRFRTMKGWLKHVGWGIAQFLWSAVPVSALALLVYNADPAAWKREGHEPIESLLAFYWIASITGGVVLGSLRRYTGSRLGKGLAGFLVALPICAVLMLMVADWTLSSITAVHVAIGLFLAAVFGPAVAAYIHIRATQRVSATDA